MAAPSLRSLLPRTTLSLRAARQTAPKSAVTQRRFQSLKAPDVDEPRLTQIDLSKLQVTTTTTPKDLLPHDQLIFGRTFTDHMLSLEWTAGDGWFAPRITPYQNLSLDPATCVLHYAFETFEGMKAYKDKKGQVRLFRPDKNMERLNRSSARIALPQFDGNKVIELIKRFCKLEERFIPS